MEQWQVWEWKRLEKECQPLGNASHLLLLIVNTAELKYGDRVAKSLQICFNEKWLNNHNQIINFSLEKSIEYA